MLYKHTVALMRYAEYLKSIVLVYLFRFVIQVIFVVTKSSAGCDRVLAEVMWMIIMP